MGGGLLCSARKDGVGLEGGRRAALHLDIIYIKINIYIIKGAKFEQNRIFATFSKKFHLCGKKFHLCGKTDRQTNKQTNRHLALFSILQNYMDLRDLGIWGFGDIGIKGYRNIGFLEVFKVFRVFRVF